MWGASALEQNRPLVENWGCEKPNITRVNFNKLIAFCQEVYARVFLARRDALFDTLDALLSGGSISSFAWLSQSERFQRKRPSLYAAVEDGRVDTQAMRAWVSD